MVLPQTQHQFSKPNTATGSASSSHDDMKSFIASVVDDPKLVSRIPSNTSLKIIRNLYCKKCSDDEFARYIYYCLRCKLDPLMGYVECVKYSSDSPAQIFLGKRAMLAIASRNKMFDGMKVGIFYQDQNTLATRNMPTSATQDDTYTVTRLDTKKSPELYAYCTVFRKDRSIPTHVEIKGREYHKGTEIWNSKYETMAKKVAMSQALEQAFPDDFAMAFASEEFDAAEERIEDLVENDDEYDSKQVLREMMLPKGVETKPMNVLEFRDVETVRKETEEIKQNSTQVADSSNGSNQDATSDSQQMEKPKRKVIF